MKEVFNMRILVVGDGKVGHMLSEHLAREGHDVVIVDKSETVLKKTQDALDVMTLKGNGANAQTLIEAEVAKADVLIAATASDETNMLCSLMGKRLGAKFAIARVRDPDYNQSLSLLQKELDIDMAINPERATALEISRLIRFPFAMNIESFARGRVEMAEFRAQEGDPFVGVPISTLNKRGQSKVLYAAIERGEEVIIPKGETVIAAGDKVYVTGDLINITAYFRQLGRINVKIKNVMIMGGGRITYYLAKMLIPLGIALTIVEIDEKKAVALSEILPEANIICGDASDQDLLEQEGIDGMDAFVALSDRDEENLLAGLYASTKGVAKVVVKNNRITDRDVIQKLGLDSIVSPKAIVCDAILRYVRAHMGGIGSAVEKVYQLMGGKAEALEFIAGAGEPYVGVMLKDLTVRKNVLVACIVRGSKVIIPFGNDHIEAGDSVIIMVNESGVADLNEVVKK